MTDDIKQKAEGWAADFWDDPYAEQLSPKAGAIGYLVGHNAALANIELDEGDLLGCCADYARLESVGGGTEGMSLKEMLSQAYYEGAKLAVERIKEGVWTKK